MPQLHNETPSAQNKRGVRITQADRELLATEYEADGYVEIAALIRAGAAKQRSFRALAKQRVKHTAELANERALVAELTDAGSKAAATIGAIYQWVDQLNEVGGITSISGAAKAHAFLTSLNKNRARMESGIMVPLRAALKQANGKGL